MVDALALIPPCIGSFSMLDALPLNYFMGGPAFGGGNPHLSPFDKGGGLVGGFVVLL